jgi:thiol-disulfide isomerase/thioredoxin
MEINSPVPDFELTDIHGKTHRLSEYRGRIVIVNFWSCECPHSERTDKAILSMFVQHMHRAADAVQVWQDDVSMLTIASNLNETAVSVKLSPKARRLPNVLLMRIAAWRISSRRRPLRMYLSSTGRASCAIAAQWMMSPFASGLHPASFWTRRLSRC